MVSGAASDQPAITLLLAVSPNSIRVYWNFLEPAGTNDAIQYVIQYRNSASSTITFNNITVTPSSELSYTIINLMAGTEYGVRIRADVSGSIGKPSDELTVRTPLEGSTTVNELNITYANIPNANICYSL